MGPLYRSDGTIDPGAIRPLVEVLQKLKPQARIYTLTGKDLEFTRGFRGHYPQVDAQIDLHLLENGAVVSRGRSTSLLVTRKGKIEEIASDPALTGKLKHLAEELARRGLAKNLLSLRLASLAYRGPEQRRRKELWLINGWLENELYPGEFYATMSGFAIFINQRGVSKWQALEHISGEEPTCALGDSLNDLESLTHASYGFLPANASGVLLERLNQEGWEIHPLHRFEPTRGSRVVYQAQSGYTRGVIEILNTILKNLL